MPMLFDTESRTDTLIRAINDILIELGPAGLSMQRISQYSGVQKSSIYHHLDNRERLLRVAIGHTSKAHSSAIRAGIATDGVLALLPRNDDELLEARAWLAWLELWRCEDFPERWIVQAREDEMAFIARATDYRLTRPELEVALAVVDGLRMALCAPRQPMRRERARVLLASHLGIPCTPIPDAIAHPWWERAQR
jgi:AcrR family transcriptional regulator